MITRQDLIDRHRKRLEYANTESSSYGSLPKSLFNEDGSFNKENWNGGDAVIRQYTGYLEWEVEHHSQAGEFELLRGVEGGIDGEFIATYSWFNDSNYVQITTRNYEWHQEGSSEWQYDQYLITYYKSRGKTEIITKNGEPITFSGYVELLNIIDATGFKFDLS